MKSRFITLEGIEGVGKSTNIEHMRSRLERRGVNVLISREPGGTGLGESIRELLLDRKQHDMSAMAELLLMFAARAQHTEQVIKPALASGQWVICDRFTDSSYAYQGGGRGIPDEVISRLESLVLGGFRPDCTILLDLPVAEGLRRAQRVGTKDRFESEMEGFFEKVRASFLSRARQNGRFHVLDASRALAEVQSDIDAIIDDLLRN